MWLDGRARRRSRRLCRGRDNGIGIAAGSECARVFEMFAQVDTSLERSRDGLGIGLTLVKTIVEMHDAAPSEVHSDGPGRGSEFAVRLPTVIASRRVAAAADRRPSARLRAAGRRILMRRRQRGRRGIAGPAVGMGGHETLRAHDGIEAIEAAERFRPDAVLLDIGLPKLNGYEVCRRIRQEPWGKRRCCWSLSPAGDSKKTVGDPGRPDSTHTWSSRWIHETRS